MPVSVRPSRSRLVLSVPAALLAAVAVAGCGGGSGGSIAASTATASGSPRAGANGFAAFAACLQQHGVTIPTRSPGAARPSGAPRSPGAGGFGGAFATSGPGAAAVKACASLRPTGGFGSGLSNNAQLQSELTAYRSCLSDHGVVLPTPAAAASGAPRGGGFGGLGALSTADSKTAAAVKACAALRPAFGRGTGAGGAAPTPAVTPSA